LVGSRIIQQEVEKVLTLQRCDFARKSRFRSDLRGIAGYGGREPEDISGSCDSHEKTSSVRRIHRYIHFPFKQEENAEGYLIFPDENFSGRTMEMRRQQLKVAPRVE
jgi:hypothetical protein